MKASALAVHVSLRAEPYNLTESREFTKKHCRPRQPANIYTYCMQIDSVENVTNHKASGGYKHRSHMWLKTSKHSSSLNYSGLECFGVADRVLREVSRSVFPCRWCVTFIKGLTNGRSK